MRLVSFSMHNFGLLQWVMTPNKNLFTSDGVESTD
jgi:hypothetical protein